MAEDRARKQPAAGDAGAAGQTEPRPTPADDSKAKLRKAEIEKAALDLAKKALDAKPAAPAAGVAAGSGGTTPSQG